MLLVLAGVLPAAAQNVRLKTDITGLEGAPLANARLLLSANTLAGEPISPGQARRLFARGGEEIALALQPFGFYRATVASSLAEARGARRGISRPRSLPSTSFMEKKCWPWCSPTS